MADIKRRKTLKLSNKSKQELQNASTNENLTGISGWLFESKKKIQNKKIKQPHTCKNTKKERNKQRNWQTNKQTKKQKWIKNAQKKIKSSFISVLVNVA